jgi:DNA-binding LytR/AlgR family response regulator
MKFQIAICDDEQAQREYLDMLVEKWALERGYLVKCQTFASAEEFLFHYEADKALDVLLLDIEMGLMNGVELAKEIRRGNERLQIVFITGYPDFMAEGYEVDALHYLLKPIKEKKLCSVLDKAVKNLGKKEPSILLSVDGEEKLFPIREIWYAEAFAHSAVLYTREGSLELGYSISELENLLGKDSVRCHRSYLVGLAHIVSITKTDVILAGNRTVPLSRREYQKVNQAFIRYYKGES